MGQVLSFPSPAAIETAWNEYSRLMAALIDTPALALNRTHMEATARAERAWKDVFLAGERQ